MNLFQDKTLDELKEMRDSLLADIESYEGHTTLNHLDIDIDLPSADVVYVKDLMELSQVLKAIAEKFAAAHHVEFPSH